MAANKSTNHQSTTSLSLTTDNNRQTNKQQPPIHQSTTSLFLPFNSRLQQPLRQPIPPFQNAKTQSTCTPFDGASGSHLPPPPPPPSHGATPSASPYQSIGMFPIQKPFTQPSVSKESTLPSSAPFHFTRNKDLRPQTSCPWIARHEHGEESSAVHVRAEKVRFENLKKEQKSSRLNFTASKNGK